jgi:thiamine transporter ThiT
MKTDVRKLCVCGICIALCYVLPVAFHATALGSVLSPMHIPVLLCGLICGWPYGGVCGIVGPLLSSLVTGMPPAAMLPSMMVECCAYGFVTGMLMRHVHTKHAVADLYISLVSAMVVGRAVAGFAKAWIFTPGISPFAWVTTSLIAGIPGIVIQLILMPMVVLALTKAKLIPNRYPKETVHE